MQINIYDLPNDILNIIMYNYMNISDIRSCLLTAKLFNVLNNFQLQIIKNSSKGKMYCVYNGLVDSLKWLYLINDSKELINNYFVSETLQIACQEGYLDVAKWIYQLSIDINISIDIHQWDDVLFINSILHDQLQFAKWLWEISLQIKKPFDIHLNNDYLFMNSCKKNNLQSCKWLYQLAINTNNPINIHKCDDFAFRFSCRMSMENEFDFLIKNSKNTDLVKNYDSLQVVKWLHKLSIDNNDPININVYVEEFWNAYISNNKKTLQWIYNLDDKITNEIKLSFNTQNNIVFKDNDAIYWITLNLISQ